MNADLVSDLAGALAERAKDHLVELDPQPDGIDGDERMLDRMLAGALSPVFLRLWRQRRCLAVPPAFARIPGFAEAAAASEAAGWPVRLRLTGGTAVAQHEGVLNISLFRREPDISIEAGFGALARLTGDALGGLGIVMDSGPVPGAACDGRFNLRWRGRKLGGTAGTIRGGRERRSQLVHAALVVEADLAEDLVALSSLERALGLETSYCLAAHVTIAEALAATRARGGAFRRRASAG